MNSLNIINRSSISDLYKLCSLMDIKNVFICERSGLKNALKNKKIKNIIFNMSNHSTHWVALNKIHKKYFDSYGEEIRLGVPKNYVKASNKKELQSIESSDCGQLCCLWLYYINYKSNQLYYNQFVDIY